MREIEKKTNQIQEVVAGGCFDCKSMVTVHMHQECMSCGVYTVCVYVYEGIGYCKSMITVHIRNA